MGSYDSFRKRMGTRISVGRTLVNNSEIVENKLFDTDMQIKRGYIYDWDMNPLEEVDFKFEKVKTRKAEGYEVEYYLHFRPEYNPELKFKDCYFQHDGKERLGFYIDVPDYTKGDNYFEKWLILAKDDRVAYDRYNAFRCNWCLEWVQDGVYHNAVCIVRYANDATFKAVNTEVLGGSSLEGTMGIELPSNEAVQAMKQGTRLIVSDSHARPQVYRVVRIKDNAPVGVTKLYCDQDLFNVHTDFVGEVATSTNIKFIPKNIIDLPYGFGSTFHMICDCIESKTLEKPDPIKDTWDLFCLNNRIYYNGDFINIEAISSSQGVPDPDYGWHIYIDDEEYGLNELRSDGYLDYKLNGNVLSLQVKSKDIIGYTITVKMSDERGVYFGNVNLKVCL